MSGRREEQEKANRIILEGSENYTNWRSYTLGKLKRRNFKWAITGKPEPPKKPFEMLPRPCMGFSEIDLDAQALYTALTSELKEHRASANKAKGIIKNSVSHKHQSILEGMTAQEMWESLKAKFQYISPMSISRLVLETIKIQLSDCTDIHDYFGKHQEAYNTVGSLIGAKCKLSMKGAARPCSYKQVYLLG